MKRLFISLYFVVVIALIIIGWSSEWVWRYIELNSNSDIERVAEISKAIRLIDDIENPDQRMLLAETINTDVDLISVSDVAWLGSQIKNLEAGEVEITYDNEDKLFTYFLINPEQGLLENSQLIRIGPIQFEAHQNTNQRIIIIISYLLLAVVIGLWSKPLWRDLNILQKAAEKFGKGQLDLIPIVSKKSIISPVVDTFVTMSERITRLIEEQKSLTNAVSHELRTPLSRLKFSLALLEKHNESNVEGMKSDVHELETLVDELLSYGRLESEGGELVLTKVNINQLLDNLVEKLALNTDKVINLNLEDDIFWICDGHFIERAVQNLITNAIRYADRKVLVSAKTAKHSLVIEVEDDGCGINENNYACLFKPFVRLDKSRTKNEGGFGLGLAIVKRIIDWHGGECNVGRSSTGGAILSLKLPKILDRE